MTHAAHNKKRLCVWIIRVSTSSNGTKLVVNIIELLRNRLSISIDVVNLVVNSIDL